MALVRTSQSRFITFECLQVSMNDSYINKKAELHYKKKMLRNIPVAALVVINTIILGTVLVLNFLI